MKKKTSEQLILSGTEEEIFSRLKERVEKAIGTIHDLRRERDALKTKVEELERKLSEPAATDTRVTALEEDCDRFQKERSEIRSRIESILVNLESLDVPTS